MLPYLKLSAVFTFVDTFIDTTDTTGIIDAIDISSMISCWRQLYLITDKSLFVSANGKEYNIIYTPLVLVSVTTLSVLYTALPILICFYNSSNYFPNKTI